MLLNKLNNIVILYFLEDKNNTYIDLLVAVKSVKPIKNIKTKAGTVLLLINIFIIMIRDAVSMYLRRGNVREGYRNHGQHNTCHFNVRCFWYGHDSKVTYKKKDKIITIMQTNYPMINKKYLVLS